MQELIYKQEAHDKLKSMYLKIEAECGFNDVAKGLRIACKAIGEIKEVDTEPVRHGLLDEDKPLTNGDRIRAMTDEELAEWFAPHMMCNECERRLKSYGCDKGECAKYALFYMKREVSEDAFS